MTSINSAAALAAPSANLAAHVGNPRLAGNVTNVTPASADLTDALDCGNVGTLTIVADPQNPSNLYTQFGCQGIWKSTDYGQTWTGPISTGTNSSVANDCLGQISLAPGATPGSAPTIFESCIRGNAFGFWLSANGGVDWINYNVAPLSAGRQDVYAPVVDPYDPKHLLMCGHEQNYVLESTDGGHTWTNINLAGGMNQPGGTGAVFFINTGNAATTRTTWLWLAQQSGGIYGTWRTTNNGDSWNQVDTNEHPHAITQIYQPGTNGVIYMPGAYSTLGWGVLRSADYGQTWAHVGITGNMSAVYGTSKNVYADFGVGGFYPILQVAAQPGTGAWAQPSAPAAMINGNAGPSQIAVVNDGTHNILVSAVWNLGLWRYVEP